MENKYKNTNEYLYEDIAIWEKTEGVEFMKSMPLNRKQNLLFKLGEDEL